ncbi:MAG: pyridoxal-dependent decarboxylase, exosortase A system-associated [Sphingomonadaceae bacterium]|nr:pyridoxal-dependent decarboxylase, exosortase A system-associated [Sphingomonadaceae bacterium]
MKPFGPIPPQFADQRGELVIGGVPVGELIEKVGKSPAYILDLAIVEEQIAAFRAAMPADVDLHLAIKANPHPYVVQSIFPLVDGLDVASAGELQIVLDAGISTDHVSFAGPGKRDPELVLAIEHGAILNLESEHEATRALAIATEMCVTPRLAVRVNPDFELKGSGMSMGGGAKPFGVDAERVPALVRKLLDGGADWRGFHIFSGSQSLDAQAIADTQAASIALSAELAQAIGARPPSVNLGGGFGIPYAANDRRLDIGPIGERLSAALAARPAILADTKFIIELGRWLVGEAGVYVARILDRKLSKGHVFLITDGGMHHHLAASGNFGMVMKRNYPVAIATQMGAEPVEAVTIAGPLCTPLDRLASDVMMPRADVGDLVAVFASGAYGLSASPSGFLSHPLPAEIVVKHGKVTT